MENIRLSAKAVIIEDNKLLVMHHRSTDGDYYILPGGGQKNGETLDAAIQRECLEEAGVKVGVIDVLYIHDYIEANHEFAGLNPGFHQVEIIFECQLLDDSTLGQGTQMDTRQIGVSWLPLDELSQHPLYPKILRDLFPQKIHRIYLGDVN